MTRRRPTYWTWLGRVHYEDASRLQVEAREALRRGEGGESLFLLEHPPLFTLGRNADPSDLVWSRDEREMHGVGLFDSDRGGQVTYHGPGQLVGYPVLNLDPDRRDLRRYVKDLERSLVLTLADFGIAAEAGEKERIGVWCGDRKIASLGVHLSRWITTHGFALNVDPDLAHFAGIVACGLPGVEMTSMARETGSAPPLEEVARRYRIRFAEVFDREMEERA